jgi:hypothetical protein
MSIDLEIISFVERDESAGEVLSYISQNPSEKSPTGSRLSKQFCSYEGGFGIAPAVISYPPSRTSSLIRSGLDSTFNESWLDFGPMSPLKYIKLDEAERHAELLSTAESWTLSGVQITGRIHDNLKFDELNQNVFLYEFFQLARRRLYIGDYQREPFFWARPLQPGSILFEIYVCFATIVAGVAHYPRIKAGFQEILLDYTTLKSWFSKALERERVFRGPRK